MIGVCNQTVSQQNETLAYLESSDNRVFDLVQVLHSASNIDHDVGSCSLRSKAPDLTHFSWVHLELVSENTGPLLGILPWGNIPLQNQKIII